MQQQMRYGNMTVSNDMGCANDLYFKVLAQYPVAGQKNY
jgi:hypothetical protein